VTAPRQPAGTAWLVRVGGLRGDTSSAFEGRAFDGVVLASAEVAPDARARRRGLLGRDGIDGALVLEPCRQVHTFRMRFPIDVAFCDGQGRVVHAVSLPPGRVSMPVWRARFAIEAEAGAFARWGLAVGDVVEVVDAAGDSEPS
jgi:uncharacterized membrane protein (UPF0127 family)